MPATKKAMVKKKDALCWIITIGILLFYIACSALIIIVGLKNSSPVTTSEDIDILQTIWDCLGNAGTLIPLAVSIVSAFLLKWKNNRLSTLSIVIISITGLFLFCFYNIHVKHQIHPVLVSLVGLITFVVSVGIALSGLTTVTLKQRSIIRTAIGNKIKNTKIVSIQIFECLMTEDNDSVNYALHSIDDLSNDSSDINGILSVSYKLKKTDVSGFDFVTKTVYQTLIESANDDTKDELINLIKEKCADIKTRLQKIPDASCVTKDDCCLARLMVMYNAYLKILSGTSSVPDAYIGEHDFRDGDLGVDVNIEKRLFTFIRTGLLGGVLAGPNCIYNFQYRKDGYKTGRQYCVFHIDERDFATRNRIILCLVVLKEGSMKAIPAYVLQAIRKMIPALEESLCKSAQEVTI